MNLLVLIDPKTGNLKYISSTIRNIELNKSVDKPTKLSASFQLDAIGFIINNDVEVLYLRNGIPLFRGVIDSLSRNGDFVSITAYDYLQKYSLIVETTDVYENKSFDEIVLDLMIPPISYGTANSFLYENISNYNSIQFQAMSRLEMLKMLAESINAFIIPENLFDSNLNSTVVVNFDEYNFNKSSDKILKPSDIEIEYNYNLKFYTGVIVNGTFGSIIEISDEQISDSIAATLTNQMYISTECVSDTLATVPTGEPTATEPSFTLTLNHQPILPYAKCEFEKINYCNIDNSYIGTLKLYFEDPPEGSGSISSWWYVLKGYDSENNLVSIPADRNGVFKTSDGVYFGRVVTKQLYTGTYYQEYNDFFITEEAQPYVKEISFSIFVYGPQETQKNYDGIAVFKKNGDFVIKRNLHIDNMCIQDVNSIYEIALRKLMLEESNNTTLSVKYFKIDDSIKLNNTIGIKDLNGDIIYMNPIDITYRITPKIEYTLIKGYVPVNEPNIEFIPDDITY